MRAKVRLAPIASASRDAHRQADKRSTIALIDPGSDHSIIHFELLPPAIQLEVKAYLDGKATNNHNIQLHHQVVMKTVSGETVADTLSLTLQATIGHWTGPLDVIVLNELPNERFIIGADFINANNATLTYGEGQEKLTLR